MKKNILIYILIIALGIMSGCGKTENNEPGTIPENANQQTSDTKGDVKSSVPSADMLDGEWKLSGVEVEGQKITVEEAGLESGITIVSTASDMTATYFNSTEYETKRFEAEVIYVEEPLYYQCENDVWSVKFGINSGDFSDDEEFYATLIDDNTLLLRHLFPFDGAQGVSHQTYTRKEVLLWEN